VMFAEAASLFGRFVGFMFSPMLRFFTRRPPRAILGAGAQRVSLKG
jgi:hypothetical protein